MRFNDLPRKTHAAGDKCATMRALLLPLAILLAGCTTADEQAQPASEPRATGPTTIVEIDANGDIGFEAAGGAEIPRVEGTRILPGVTRLDGTFTMTSGTGFQLGYSSNAGRDFTWLDPFPPGTTEFELPVDAWEENGERWVFYREAVTGAAGTPGAIVNGWSLRLVTALD